MDWKGMFCPRCFIDIPLDILPPGAAGRMLGCGRRRVLGGRLILKSEQFFRQSRIEM